MSPSTRRETISVSPWKRSAYRIRDDTNSDSCIMRPCIQPPEKAACHIFPFAEPARHGKYPKPRHLFRIAKHCRRCGYSASAAGGSPNGVASKLELGDAYTVDFVGTIGQAQRT